MGGTTLQRVVGALQIIGGVAELYYGGGAGFGGGGGYLIGSGIENVQGKKGGSYNQPGGFGADLMGSLGVGGYNRHASKAGLYGGAAGGLVGGLGGGGAGGGYFGNLGQGNLSLGKGIVGGLGGNYGGGLLLGGSGGGGLINGLGGMFGGGGADPNGGGFLGGSYQLSPQDQAALGQSGAGGGGGFGSMLKSPQGLNLVQSVLKGLQGEQAAGQVSPSFQEQATQPHDYSKFLEQNQFVSAGAQPGQRAPYQNPPTNIIPKTEQPPTAPGSQSMDLAKLLSLLQGFKDQESGVA